MALIYGYARRTVALSDPEVLATRLGEAGAETIFVEKTTGPARRAMRERGRMLDQIASGDTLVLLSLDALGTSFEDLVRCLQLLVERSVNVKIADAGFETGGPFNHAYRDVLRLLADARSALHSEAIRLALAAARAKGGKVAGKPPSLTAEQWPDIQARISRAPLDRVAEDLGVSRQTLWTYRRRMAKLETTRPT